VKQNSQNTCIKYVKWKGTRQSFTWFFSCSPFSYKNSFLCVWGGEQG